MMIIKMIIIIMIKLSFICQMSTIGRAHKQSAITDDSKILHKNNQISKIIHTSCLKCKCIFLSVSPLISSTEDVADKFKHLAKCKCIFTSVPSLISSTEDVADKFKHLAKCIFASASTYISITDLSQPPEYETTGAIFLS